MTGYNLIIAGMAVSLVTGCASLPDKYVPTQIGPHSEAETIDGLSVTIRAVDDQIPMGRPAIFEVVIANQGNNSFWVPQSPDILFTWIYSNGRRDNFVKDFSRQEHFSKLEAVKLDPGQSYTKRIEIPTGFFPRKGITEFRAIYHAAYSTNPALTPFWSGKVYSNSYGIKIYDRGYTPSPAFNTGNSSKILARSH